MRLLFTIINTAGLLATLATAAQAWAEYAAREKKPCAYCHVDPKGGGALNARGIYYEKNGFSFKGYKEGGAAGAQAAKKTGPPAFKSLFKIDVPAGARRIGVGDLAGDMKPRLVVLGQGTTATVHNLSGDEPKQEASVDLGPNALKFVVGDFAKGKPALIAVPGAIFYKDGDNYVKKEATDLTDITGTVRFADGEECIFFYAGGMPDVWEIDLSAAKPVVPGREMVMPSEAGGVYSSLIAHFPPEFAAGLGLPEDAQKVGVLGYYDPRGDGNLYSWMARNGKEGSHVLLANNDAIGPAGAGTEIKPVWRSPKLAGKVLDVALGLDPKGSKTPGLFVLMETGEDGKGRAVEFFVLD